MTYIRVRDIAGKYCITLQEGERLFKAIHPILGRGQPIELDFEGVSMYASPFFNAAIAQLARDIPRDQVRRLLSVKSLSSDGQLVLQRAIENGYLYFGNPSVRAILDQQASDS